MDMMRLSEVIPPDAGTLTAVHPSPHTRAQAIEKPVIDTLMSTLQRDHLHTRSSGHAQQDELWLGVTWKLPHDVTPDALAAALTSVARKHEVLRSWYQAVDLPVSPEDQAQPNFVRCSLDQADVSFVPAEPIACAHLVDDVTAELRQGCSPFEAFGYALLRIDGGGATRLIFAMDHVYGDAQSLLIMCEEIHRHLVGEEPLDAPSQGYTHFVTREREKIQSMNSDDTAVQKWLEFFQRGDPVPDLGAFPGWSGHGRTPCSLEPHRFGLFTESQATVVEKTAAAWGANLVSVLYAAIALAARDVAQTHSFRFVNPIQLRNAEEMASVGWYTGLVPMHVDVRDDDNLASLAPRVREEFSRQRSCASTPFLEAYRILAASLGESVSSWGGRFMLSYLDTRLFSYDVSVPPQDLALVSQGGEDVNVSAWIFRGADETEVLVVAPRNPEAATAIARLFSRAQDYVAEIL